MSCDSDLVDLHSFPTRRSSDLWCWEPHGDVPGPANVGSACAHPTMDAPGAVARPASPVPDMSDGDWRGDRKSTRLNSSHVAISYAVFCLKKKSYTLHV